VAARLQVNDKTVYAWVSLGKIPCLKVNGVIRFEERELDLWLDGCRLKAGNPSRLSKRTSKGPQRAIDMVIERAKRAVYTPRHGETRPTASPNGKEGVWGS
jgi:excisionase family DNA binding protein